MDGHHPESVPPKSQISMGARQTQGTELGLQVYLRRQLSTQELGQKFFRILFLPKDGDEIEALTKRFFKAKTREKLLP